MSAQSLVRRFLAVLSAASLAGVFAVAVTTGSASAAPIKGSLEVVSVTDTDNPEFGVLIQDQSFDVAVRVLDTAGAPTTVPRATTIVLEEVFGPGSLTGNTSATIPRNGSGTTISGARYSPYANDVVLRVRVQSGVELESDDVSVDVTLTAVGREAVPGDALNLDDQNCDAPTSQKPTCGRLILPNGANGQVVMSVGSCEGLRPEGQRQCLTVGDTKALVVTAAANMEGLYTNKDAPATLILACDKVLCGQSGAGLPQLPVVYTLNNEGDLLTPAPTCPAKGVLGDTQEVCVDYVQSSRQQGDLYTYILFDRDPRFSHP
jgi:hypothetical protein